MSSSWPRLRLLVVCLLFTALGLVTLPGSALAGTAAADPAAPAATGVDRAALAAPDAALGAGWRASGDVLVAGAGDANGYHLYLAREKDAFAWSTLATLRSAALDLGTWTGHVCVTGSGRYAVAVYAPAMAANKPALLAAGGLAAVVDIATGAARTVATGVQLAYFDPACGPGDRVLLTRAVSADDASRQQTDLLTLDAAAGRVTSTRRVHAQLTNPAPAPDGDYGVAHGALVRVSATGALQQVARPQGQPFAVSATSHSGLDIVSGTGRTAIVERYAGPAAVGSGPAAGLRRLGAGPVDRLQLLSLAGGRNVLVGDTNGVATGIPQLATLAAGRPVEAVSEQGHLLAERVLSRAVAGGVASPLAGPGGPAAGLVDVTVRATRSGQLHTGTVATTQVRALDAIPAGPASQPAPSRPARPAGRPTAPASAAPGNTEAAAPSRVALADVPTPTCAVPRNDPAAQALQPSPNMVEWAVDQAVHGNLAVQSSTFPKHSVAGGGTVPAQLFLAILAQESNLSEASWHAVPGDTGNPLVSDYYGNRRTDGSTDINTIDYTRSDCGYGIGQVTTGMRATDTVYSHAAQIAIGTDYKANIAAALNILIDKWNQVHNDPAGASWVNNGDADYVENWYLAIWAYNSGFHPSSEAGANHGHWGVGWLNNPANPVYPYNRHRFLADYGDASHPSDWSYPEKVMGWVEVPQKKGDDDAYAKPNFGAFANGQLYLPNNESPPWPRWFCSLDVNNCDRLVPQGADPCPAESDACWWHGHLDFAGCANDCATERLSYAAGSSEPALQRIYPRSCADIDIGRDQYITSGLAPVVYDLNDTSQYALGCATHPTNGKFTLRVGSPANNTTLYPYGQIDLHQVGSGYQGHMWFTHVYAPSAAGKHKVVGTWSPDLEGPRVPGGTPNTLFDIVVHLPSHGGEYDHAQYIVEGDPLTGVQQSCTLDQSTSGIFGGNGHDEWRYLGHYTLRQGARVMLGNIGVNGDDGSVDVGYDAMAFIPISGAGHSCNQAF
jgi:hypothetical protein